MYVYICAYICIITWWLYYSGNYCCLKKQSPGLCRHFYVYQIIDHITTYIFGLLNKSYISWIFSIQIWRVCFLVGPQLHNSTFTRLKRVNVPTCDKEKKHIFIKTWITKFNFKFIYSVSILHPNFKEWKLDHTEF